MSHLWRKPITLVVSGAVVLGVLAMSVSAVSARYASGHARPASASNVTFSFDQFPDGMNIAQAGTVVDVLVDGVTNPAGPTTDLYGPNGKPQYFAITVPKESNHGLTWAFSLHKGMKWSNGDAITNKDYLFGWHVYMNAGVCAGSCDNIKSISLNKNGVGITVHMKTIYAQVLVGAIGAIPLFDHKWNLGGRVTSGQLASCLASISGCAKYASVMTTDATLNYEDSSYVVGGPYEVNTFNNNNEITFKRDPNYTSSMPGGKPTIPQETFLFYTSVPDMIAGAANKDTDVTEDYVLNDVGSASHSGTLRSFHQFKTYVGGAGNPEVLTFNQRNAVTDIEGQNAANGVHNPFVGHSGKLVRLALLLAFDKAKLIANAFGPLDLKTASSLVSYSAPIGNAKGGSAPYADKSINGAWDPIRNKYMPSYCATSKKNGGDGNGSKSIKDAEKLLKEAGYGSNHHLHVYLSSTTAPWRPLEQGYLQQCWQALGSWLTVTVENVKATHYFGNYTDSPPGVLAIGHFEADIHGYGGVSPDPDGWKGNFRGDKCQQDPPHIAAQANIDCFNDPVINKALNKGGATFNTAQRKRWYYAFQVEVSRQGDWSYLAPRPNIWTWDGNPSKGFQMNSWATAGTWNAPLWK